MWPTPGGLCFPFFFFVPKYISSSSHSLVAVARTSISHQAGDRRLRTVSAVSTKLNPMKGSKGLGQIKLCGYSCCTIAPSSIESHSNPQSGWLLRNLSRTSCTVSISWLRRLCLSYITYWETESLNRLSTMHYCCTGRGFEQF